MNCDETSLEFLRTIGKIPRAVNISQVIRYVLCRCMMGILYAVQDWCHRPVYCGSCEDRLALRRGVLSLLKPEDDDSTCNCCLPRLWHTIRTTANRVGTEQIKIQTKHLYNKFLEKDVDQLTPEKEGHSKSQKKHWLSHPRRSIPNISRASLHSCFSSFDHPDTLQHKGIHLPSFCFSS